MSIANPQENLNRDLDRRIEETRDISRKIKADQPKLSEILEKEALLAETGTYAMHDAAKGYTIGKLHGLCYAGSLFVK